MLIILLLHLKRNHPRPLHRVYIDVMDEDFATSVSTVSETETTPGRDETRILSTVRYF